MIAAAFSITHKFCHPERSLGESEANRQTESKDPYSADGARGGAGHFYGVVRFFGDQGAGVNHNSSRKAATGCSPRRKPWGDSKNAASPVGAKENIAGNTNQAT